MQKQVLFGCIVTFYHTNEFVPHECSLVLQQLDVTEEHQVSHVQHYQLVQAGEVVVVVGGKVEQVMLVLGVSCSYIVDYWRQKPLSTLFCAEELQVFDELFDFCCQNIHINITDQ